MNRNLLIGIGAVILVGVTVTALVVSGVFPFKKSSQEILEKAKEEMLNLKSYKSEGRVSLEITGEKYFKGELNFSGMVDNTEPKNQKSVSDFNLTIGIEGMELSFAAAFKMIGKEIYLKVKTIPLFFAGFPGVDQIKNQWIKIDMEKLKAAEKESFSSLTPKEKEKITEDIRNLLRKGKIFKVKKELGKEKVGEEKTYHYLVTVEPKEFKRFVLQLLEIIKEYSNKESEDVEKVEVFSKEFSEKFDEFWQKIGGMDIEVWIGEKTKFLRKVKGEKEFSSEETPQLKEGTVKLSFQIEFSDFNKEFQIEPPKDFKLLEEIFPSSMEEEFLKLEKK